jgi:muramoyltetrapeptide carboxypeptidase LdcA involved in peptidoglycan recycling
MGASPAVKPRHLVPGDTVAVVSPSWGGPSLYPHVYDHGLVVLRDWGLEVREFPSARAPAERLQRDPRLRADDLGAAFADPSIRAIVPSIGGDDSIRLLPLLDEAVITANPKILMGFSDTTTLLVAGRRLGMVTFHGPSIMAGFSQMAGLPPAYRTHVHEMLFEARSTYAYVPYDIYAEGYPHWRDPATVGQVNPLRRDDGWHVLQGAGRVTGELLGGCLEVLDWLRGTSAWPVGDEWSGRLLFFEPSEEKPTPLRVERILRSFGVQGIFDRVTGVLVGRARDHSAEENAALEAAIRGVVAEEFGRPDLPIVANLPFGHTDPQWVLPLGVQAELDVHAQTLRLIEPWLA